MEVERYEEKEMGLSRKNECESIIVRKTKHNAKRVA
jgi:hypothetical protein